MWSGEAFLCVLLAARVLLPSLVGVISRGNSLMVKFRRFEMMGFYRDTSHVQIKKEKLGRRERSFIRETVLMGVYFMVLKVYFSHLVLHLYKILWTHKNLN